MKQFDRGDKVMTPLGPGKVNYKRMAAPTYAEAEVYSVLLDDKVEATKHPPYPSYSGTIFPAEDVKENVG